MMKSYKYYLLTIRLPQKLSYVSTESLLRCKDYLNKHLFDVLDYQTECHGKYKQLHMHCIIRTSPRFYYKPHLKQGKFRLDFKQIKDSLSRVSSYIHKHNPNEEYEIQTYYTNYYRYHYGFQV